MLNGRALNRSALNATAAAVALLAAASFTASATVTASGTHQQAASANINCSVQAIFGGERERFAFWSGSASATPTFIAGKILGASGFWTAESSFTGFIEYQVWAEAGFDVSSSLELLADVTLAEGAWVGGSQTDWAGRKAGSLKGQWEGESTFLAEGSRTRLANAAWTPESALWAEPTVTIGGITYHEGYTFHTGKVTWTNVPYLTATFINGALHQAEATWVGNAHLIGSGRGTWAGSVEFNIPPTKIHPARCDLSHSSTFVADPLYEGGVGASLEGTSQWVIKPRVKHAAKQQLSAGSTFTVQAKKKGRLKATFSHTAILTMAGLRMAGTTVPLTSTAAISINSQRVRLATATWDGMGSILGGGAVLTTAPATQQRTFVIPYEKRVFVLSGASSFSG